MQATGLDWSTAAVKGSRLTVALDGKPPKGWSDSFDRAARLLNHGRFAKIRAKGGSVRIEPIVPGDEDLVRHFLESVVQEANAHVVVDPDRGGESSTDAPTGEDGAMTERFRAFAQAGD